jgi:hypothetical protein
MDSARGVEIQLAKCIKLQRIFLRQCRVNAFFYRALAALDANPARLNPAESTIRYPAISELAMVGSDVMR